jgi:hypothetical protein
MAADVELSHPEQLALVRLASSTGHLAGMARALTPEDVTAALGDGAHARLATGALSKIRAALEQQRATG